VPADGVALAAQIVSGMPASSDGLPFRGGAVGYIAYEWAKRYVDPDLGTTTGPLPAYHFALYDQAYVFDHERGAGRFVGRSPERFMASGAASAAASRRLGVWSASVTEEQHRSDVKRILGHIEAGDIYQANYTVRFSAEGAADSAAIALALKSRNPSPMGACLVYPFGTIWSCSPERLLEGVRRGRLESVPIKGTRGREADPELDRLARLRLAQSPKDQAELLMIVDLVRNDLGRVARTGSVKVDHLYRVQSYANVHHLEAHVKAEMDRGTDWHDVLGALLPGGSVTGAPKRRSVEILSSLERVPRSVYTGALGYFSFDGHADFSLPIRTLYHDGVRFHLHSGGGIVADSDPRREYEECLVKVANIRGIVEDVCRGS
jgi:para-aminobenzoate synthetase component 1